MKYLILTLMLLILSLQGGAQPADTIANIGSRRELMIDNRLIDRQDNLQLRLNAPRDEGPVLPFDKPWEGAFSAYVTVIHHEGTYQLYYRGLAKASPGVERMSRTCYAESRDGIHWSKPELGMIRIDGSTANNVILSDTSDTFTHNFCPFYDLRPGVDPDQRYKALGGTEKSGLIAFVSADGIHWQRLREEPVITEGLFDSQNVSFWSAAESTFVCYFRSWTGEGYNGYRTVSRCTSVDFIHWSDPVEMTYGETPPEHIYINQTHPYFRAPHIYVATAARFLPDRQILTRKEAQSVGVDSTYKLKGCSEAVLMTSRGGNRYDRTFMEGFIRPGIGAENWVPRSNYPALNVVPTGPTQMSLYLTQDYAQDSAHLHRYSLRLDGFASLRAPWSGGSWTSVPLLFTGDRLSLNMATSAAGSMRVELQDSGGKALPGFELEACQPIIGNELDHTVVWEGNPDLSAWAGVPVRIHMKLVDADLYAFQFTTHQQGETHP